jgi:hypothetical protein
MLGEARRVGPGRKGFWLVYTKALLRSPNSHAGDINSEKAVANGVGLTRSEPGRIQVGGRLLKDPKAW